jgi:hypothetical protein
MSEATPSDHDGPDARRRRRECGPAAGTGTPLAELAAELRAAGGLLAATLVAEDGPAEHGAVAAARGPEYALVVETIREGYLQHYGRGRVLRPEDPDLALLAGDRLYAAGLARLAALGDVAAVAVLADVISRSAQAHAEGDPSRADAAWRLGAETVAAG